MPDCSTNRWEHDRAETGLFLASLKASWRETFRHLLICLILSDFGRVHMQLAIWFVFPKTNLKRTVRREQNCMKCSVQFSSVISRTVKKQIPQFPLQSACWSISWSSLGRSGLGEHIGRLQGDGAYHLIIHAFLRRPFAVRRRYYRRRPALMWPKTDRRHRCSSLTPPLSPAAHFVHHNLLLSPCLPTQEMTSKYYSSCD